MRNIPHFKEWRPLPVGDGQRLSLKITANGKSFQNYGISFTEPWLGGRKPQSLTVSANKSVQRYMGSGSTGPADLNSSMNVDNISVGVGRVLEWPDNYFTLLTTLGYTKYTVKNAPNFGLGCANCSSHAVTLNATIARNSIDNPMYPGQGSSISLSGTFTPPYSTWKNLEGATEAEKNEYVEYYKVMFDSKFYVPLDRKKKFVIEAKAHFGFLGAYSKDLGVGPF